MNDGLDNTTDVAIALGVIEVAELRGRLVVVGVRLELFRKCLLDQNKREASTEDVRLRAIASVRG